MNGWRGWLIWCVVVFGILNAGSTHEEQREVSQALSRGEFRLTPASAVLALRAYLNNEGDVRRYFAYGSAALGRPYSSYYVRTAAEWRRAFAALDNREPEEFATVTPTRPLVPYRDFLVEYPPGFFLVCLPLVAAADKFEHFQLLFATAMGLLLTLALLICRSMARELGLRITGGQLAAWGGVCALLLGVMVTHRYDAAIAALLAGSCWAALRRRPALFGLLLGLAVATKLTPLLCAPPWALAWLHRRRLRELAVATATGTATLVAAALPTLFGGGAGQAMLEMLRYHRDRPLQSESTAGALFALLGGPEVRSVFTFGSFNLVGPHLQAALTATTLATALGLALIFGLTLWLLGRRAKPEREREGRLLVSATVAALVVFMLAGKVLSPQYLVWLLPLGMVLSVGDRAALALFVALSALTQLIYPICYGALIDLRPFALALVVARNALLAAWTLRVYSSSSRP